MKRILFGGPHESKEHNDRHDSLVNFLRSNYQVNYVNNGQEMLWEIDGQRMYVYFKEKNLLGLKNITRFHKYIPYNLIIYDFDLFYDLTPPEKRATFFKDTTGLYLKSAELPAIIFVPKNLEELLKQPVLESGFSLLTYPYDLDDVLAKVKKILD